MPAPDEMSDYGKLNEMRKQLVEESRRTPDDALRSRLNILIANIDFLKANPGDPQCLKKFAENTADLERYKAGGT
jgi:hypothetical protein